MSLKENLLKLLPDLLDGVSMISQRDINKLREDVSRIVDEAASSIQEIDSVEGRWQTLDKGDSAFAHLEHPERYDSLLKLAWRTGWSYGYIARNKEILENVFGGGAGPSSQLPRIPKGDEWNTCPAKGCDSDCQNCKGYWTIWDNCIHFRNPHNLYRDKGFVVNTWKPPASPAKPSLKIEGRNP